MERLTAEEIRAICKRWRKRLTGYEDKGPLCLGEILSERTEWDDDEVTLDDLEGILDALDAAEQRAKDADYYLASQIEPLMAERDEARAEVERLREIERLAWAAEEAVGIEERMAAWSRLVDALHEQRKGEA